jgi:bacillithiol biosynthesis deacetylase BshB1
MVNILAVGAHPDDVEIGMGGTILALKEQGYKVGILHITDGEPTPNGTPEKRRAEAKAAAKVLGLDFMEILSFPNRYLQDTIEARQAVAEVIRLERPELLFVPFWIDAHPDHVAANHIAEAARFYAKLTKTEMKGEPHYPRRVYSCFTSHLRQLQNPDFIFDTSKHIDKKLEAIACYHSQFDNRIDGFNVLDGIRAMNRYWGAMIRRTYGEPFFCREKMGLAGIKDLI